MTGAPRVLVLDPHWDAGGLERALEELDVRVERAERAEGDDVVGVAVSNEQPVGRTELAQLPRLRAVATCSTGFDHLDVEALAAAGVWATNVAGYCTEEVAEHTIALVVGLLRGIAALDGEVRAGRWDLAEPPPRRVAGAGLGIVGLGRIGRSVAWRAAALGMHVLALDPLVDAASMHAAGAAPAKDLAELLAAADVVTLHTPLTPESRHLIDAAALAHMRPDAYIVNCARAELIDHAALGAALRAGRLGGAALDVLPQEPPDAAEPALGWPRTVLNPHSSWYSDEAQRECFRLAGRQLMLALSGQRPDFPLATPTGR